MNQSIKLSIQSTTLELIYGNIFEQNDIDALINPANEWLDPIGGLSELIATTVSVNKTCSSWSDNFLSAIDQSLNEQRPLGKLTDQNRRCLTGHALITPSFELKWNSTKRFNHLIHTVGPQANEKDQASFTDEKKQQLYNAHYNILTLTEKNHIKSLAIPPISTGMFGVQMEDYIPIGLQAINDYFVNNPESIITEVRIVMAEETKLDAFKSYIAKNIDLNKDMNQILYDYNPNKGAPIQDQEIKPGDLDKKTQAPQPEKKQSNNSKKQSKTIFASILKTIRKKPAIPIFLMVGILIGLIVYNQDTIVPYGWQKIIPFKT